MKKRISISRVPRNLASFLFFLCILSGSHLYVYVCDHLREYRSPTNWPTIKPVPSHLIKMSAHRTTKISNVKKKNNRIVKKTNQNLIELPGFQTSDTVIYNTPRITVLVSFSWRTFLDCRTQWHYSIEKQKKKNFAK